MPPSDLRSEGHQAQNWELSVLAPEQDAFEKATMGRH